MYIYLDLTRTPLCIRDWKRHSKFFSLDESCRDKFWLTFSVSTNCILICPTAFWRLWFFLVVNYLVLTTEIVMYPVNSWWTEENDARFTIYHVFKRYISLQSVLFNSIEPLFLLNPRNHHNRYFLFNFYWKTNRCHFQEDPTIANWKYNLFAIYRMPITMHLI